MPRTSSDGARARATPRCPLARNREPEADRTDQCGGKPEDDKPSAEDSQQRSTHYGSGDDADHHRRQASEACAGLRWRTSWKNKEDDVGKPAPAEKKPRPGASRK